MRRALGQRDTNRKDTKGALSRARYAEEAYRVARLVGLEGLSIGELSSELGVSKSGLFAHFGSKENLQLAVLDRAADDFRQAVFVPALEKSRGVERVRAIFERWLDWAASAERGGCVFLSSAMDYDDREGAVREAVAGWFQQLHQGLERTFWIAVCEGELPQQELAQLVTELHGIVLQFHLEARLLRRPGARERAQRALTHLLERAGSAGGPAEHS